jgi:hypothetical protein
MNPVLNVGTDPHPTVPGTYDPNAANPSASPWFRDINPATGLSNFDNVGKIGLGDLKLSEDGQWLYTVNLLTR